jgi:hypothetical protein
MHTVKNTPGGSRRIRRPLQAIAAAAGGAVVLLVLAACSGTATAGGSPQPSASGGQGQTQDRQGRAGVSGLIAYAKDDLLQVQGDSEQTAVRYTADTTVRRTTTVEASTIAVGDCIVAVTAQDADSATSLTVTAVEADGTCSTGFGGGQGRGGQNGDQAGMPTGAPSGAPSDGQGGGMPAPGDGVAPSGAPGSQGGQGFGTFTSGQVTAVSGSTLTVKTTSADAQSSTATVALGSATTVSATVDAKTSDIAVGLCVTAMGKADDKGGYDATSLTLSDPASDGTCSSGFGLGRPGGRNGNGTGTGTQGGSNG